jgi:hypothetical protein
MRPCDSVFKLILALYGLYVLFMQPAFGQLPVGQLPGGSGGFGPPGGLVISSADQSGNWSNSLIRTATVDLTLWSGRQPANS